MIRSVNSFSYPTQPTNAPPQGTSVTRNGHIGNRKVQTVNLTGTLNPTSFDALMPPPSSVPTGKTELGYSRASSEDSKNTVAQKLSARVARFAEIMQGRKHVSFSKRKQAAAMCADYFKRNPAQLEQLLREDKTLLDSVHKNIQKELFADLDSIPRAENLFLLLRHLDECLGRQGKEQLLKEFESLLGKEGKSCRALKLMLQTDCSDAESLHRQLKDLKLSSLRDEGMVIREFFRGIFEGAAEQGDTSLAMSFMSDPERCLGYLKFQKQNPSQLAKACKFASDTERYSQMVRAGAVSIVLARLTSASLSKELRNFVKALEKKYPTEPTLEQQMEIAQHRAEKFKEKFFSPENFTSLASLLQEATQGGSKRSQQLFYQLAFTHANSFIQTFKVAPEKVFEFCRDPIHVGAFAEAFSKPNVLTAWERSLARDSVSAHAFKKNLTYIANSSPPGALKDFAKLWLSDSSFQLDGTPIDRIAQSKTLLKQLKEGEWVQLQQSCAHLALNDSKFREALYLLDDYETNGISKLALHWLDQVQTSADGSSLLEATLKNTPGFDSLAGELLTRYTQRMPRHRLLRPIINRLIKPF